MSFDGLNFIEKIYIGTSIVTAIGSFILGLVVFLKNKNGNANKKYFNMSLSITLWSLALFFCHLAVNKEIALFLNRVLHLGSIFIPITFYHFIICLLEKYSEKNFLLKLGYVISFIFICFVFTPYFVFDLQPKFAFHLWPVPGKMYPYFLMFVSFYFWYSLWLAFRGMLNSKGIKRNQLKFVFMGALIGVSGGSTNYAYFYNVPIPPVGNFFVFIYVVLFAYAIIRYRLMDVRVVFTRLSVFLFVYTLVLGVPFFIGYNYQVSWIIPVSIMAVLATLGPFIYLFLQKKAEDRLFQEQRQYQATLRSASLGMAQIKDLGHLVKLIVHIVLRAVRIEHCKIFLLHEDSKKYILKAYKGRQKFDNSINSINIDNLLVGYLNKISNPIILDEIKQKEIDYKDESLKVIKEVMTKLDGEVIVPSFVEKKLIAFLVLGKKVSGQLYSQDDLSVFSILANQAALAIENAMFYEQTQKTTEQLFRAEKMATIGTMADGLSHQINNRLHAMGFVAGDALDSLRLFLKKKTDMDPETKQLAEDLLYSLERIQDNVKRGGEIVGGLLRYTRKGAEGVGPVDLGELLDSSLEMAQFKIKMNQFDLVRNFNGQVPKINGNFTQLQEVFFNVIDNAYDAMMQRKVDLKEPEFKARLEVSAVEAGGNLNIIFRDNGIGVKVEELQKVFTPFFTTKATSKKGTGLGMYVIRQIIENNHGGKVKFYSKYKEGTEITVTLPVV